MTDPANQNPNPPTSVLDTLVGTGKKFADPEALAKGKMEADTFIETLKREKHEAVTLVSQQDARIRNLEGKLSLLDRLAVNPNPDQTTTVTSSQPAPQPSVPGLTKEDVLKVIADDRTTSRQLTNKQAVDSGLIKVFGANAADEVRKRCNDLGVDPTEFNNLALSSPKAAFALLQINPSAPTSTTYRATGTPSAVPNNTNVRNAAWYEAEKLRMGPVKFMRDAKLMVQRHKDMEALGDNWDS